MFVVRKNRNVRQTFCSLCSFSAIFILCISVCIIFVSTSEKNTEFNTKYDKDKWTYRLNDDVIETVTFTNNNVPTEEYRFIVDNTYMKILYIVVGISILALLYWFFHKYWRRAPNNPDIVRPDRVEPVVHFDGERARMDNDPNIVQPDGVEPVVEPIDNDEIRWWNIFGAAEAG